MVVDLILAVAGLALLTVAADHLVLGSSRVAAWLRINPVIIGVVVIGLGTSAPEFLVSGLAAARGNDGIAIGNIVGSNILNLSLVLGVAALIRPLSTSSNVVRREVRLAVAAVLLLALGVVIGLRVWTAIVLLMALAASLTALTRWAARGRETALAEEATSYIDAPAPVDVPGQGRRRFFEPLRAVLGLVGLLLGAQLLVTNASAIASREGVSQVTIGLTLVAVGTSLPELVTTVASQRRGESDLVIGNLFGSNLFNSLAGGAVIGLVIGPGHTARGALGLLVVMVLTTVIAWALLRRGLALTRAEGAVLVAVYALSIPVVLSA